MSKVLIYALCCPITGDVRYVGRTVNSLQRRLREHIGISLRGKMKHKQKEDTVLGVKHGVVCRMRNRLGIATYRSTRKKS